MLGSFPPPKHRWSMDFYYPNFQNDMWRILGDIFYYDQYYFILPHKKAFDRIKAIAFCEQYCVGIWDTAEEIIRLSGNASDIHLQVVKAFDLKTILQSLSECKTIVITGQKAMEILLSVFDFTEPKIWTFSLCEVAGRLLRIYRMPSTSRAYPKPLLEKTKIYTTMFQEIWLI